MAKELMKAQKRTSRSMKCPEWSAELSAAHIQGREGQKFSTGFSNASIINVID